MRPLRFLFVGLQRATMAAAARVSVVGRSVADDLQSLAPASSVAVEQLRERWSEVEAPVAHVVFNATSEKDISEVVKYCVSKKIRFVAQNGGNGWARGQVDLGGTGVLINLAGLNQVRVSADKKTATIGGGAIISEVVAAADGAGVLVQTGNCNCVGALGATLGGGYGNLVGEHGLGVDNTLELRVVTAAGDMVTASGATNPDLFWALRGAGPNFGIVTSAKVNAFPGEDRTALIVNLTFDGSKMAAVAQAIQDLALLPQQVVYLVLSNSADGTNTPTVVVTGFLRGGTAEGGRAAYAALFDLGPLTSSSVLTPYRGWNAANDAFCARGGRKPAFSTTIDAMRPHTWPRIWELYKAFHGRPGAHNSAVLIERYNLTAAQAAPAGSSAFADEKRRGAFAQAIVIPWYEDPALDAQAEAFGAQLRDIWSFSSSAVANPTYINFAHGDEELQAIYGSALDRLRTLKQKFDPAGVFNQWFPIK